MNKTVAQFLTDAELTAANLILADIRKRTNASAEIYDVFTYDEGVKLVQAEYEIKVFGEHIKIQGAKSLHRAEIIHKIISIANGAGLTKLIPTKPIQPATAEGETDNRTNLQRAADQAFALTQTLHGLAEEVSKDLRANNPGKIDQLLKLTKAINRFNALNIKAAGTLDHANKIAEERPFQFGKPKQQPATPLTINNDKLDETLPPPPPSLQDSPVSKDIQDKYESPF